MGISIIEEDDGTVVIKDDNNTITIPNRDLGKFIKHLKLIEAAYIEAQYNKLDRLVKLL